MFPFLFEDIVHKNQVKIHNGPYSVNLKNQRNYTLLLYSNSKENV